MFQSCDFVPQICGSLLGALNGSGTGLREGRIAGIFLLREGEIRLGRGYVGTGLFDAAGLGPPALYPIASA